MARIGETIKSVVDADTWNQRVARIRSAAQNHAPNDLPQIYAAIARQAYVEHLSPDFAYIHEAPFYERRYFAEIYASVREATSEFRKVNPSHLSEVLQTDARRMLVLRTILGLTRQEFAHSTSIVAEATGYPALSDGKIGSCEQSGTRLSYEQAYVAALTIDRIIEGTLFAEPPGDLHPKQQKIDTARGWDSVKLAHDYGVSYSDLLHQRHYGGAFRQITDATSTKRGDMIEDAVEQLFIDNEVPYIRTGSHNQSEIAEKFELTVIPAPDFVVYDEAGTLRALLECKLTGDGGTARDKALRFERLRDESLRLGGTPLIAVLAGMGWSRVNDTLGPVVRDTDGRVFTLSTLPEMLTVSPFPGLIGTAVGA